MTVLETAPPEPGALPPPLHLPAALPGLPRVLGDAGSPEAGPTLLVVAGIHGNEPGGVLALQRLFARLAGDRCTPRGRVVGLAGNLAALAAGKRHLVEDLNRAWRPERLARVRVAGDGLAAEEAELAALDAAIRRVVSEAGGPVFALDLHSTSGPGPAFAVLHDALRNRRFARSLPVPAVLGLEEELSGTLTDHLTESGISALSVETGQHNDPGSAERAAAAVWLAMDVAGVLPECFAGELEAARARLATAGDLPPIVEVRYRHAIPESDGFRMDPGFASFQPVRAGQPLAQEHGVPVRAPFSGYLLMPLYQAQGNDGFFLTRPVRPAWLALSAALRPLGLERFLHWLPGVSRLADRPGAFSVDRRVARWGARQLFHLLGFRRHRTPGQRHLVMVRRGSDAR